MLLCVYCFSLVIKRKEDVLIKCNNCGKPFHRKRRDLVRRSQLYYCSHTCYRASLCGSKNPNWRGGVKTINSKIRASEEYTKWQQAVLQRDQWTCVLCGAIGYNLHVHHIVHFAHLLDSYKYYNKKLDYEGLLKYEPLWNVSNGVTLCKSCHDLIPKKVNKDEVWIAPRFYEILKKGSDVIVARSAMDVIQRLGLSPRTNQ